jgi:hypothetical protein
MLRMFDPIILECYSSTYVRHQVVSKDILSCTVIPVVLEELIMLLFGLCDQFVKFRLSLLQSSTQKVSLGIVIIYLLLSDESSLKLLRLAVLMNCIFISNLKIFLNHGRFEHTV